MSDDLIIGLHSIAHALKNPDRGLIRFAATEEGLSELRSRGECSRQEIERIKCEIYSLSELQNQAAKEFVKRRMDPSRVPSGIFLIAEPLEIKDLNWLYDEAVKNQLKILALDQVTDVHNAAAIMRTAAFYGVKVIIIPQKGSFGFSPSFFRIASGATEHISLVQTSSLPKAISKLQEMGIVCIGLSEHSEGELQKENLETNTSTCLVLGAEDVGLSNAVARIIKINLALKSLGNIKSLNVSVASAIAMEKVFGKQS